MTQRPGSEPGLPAGAVFRGLQEARSARVPLRVGGESELCPRPGHPGGRDMLRAQRAACSAHKLRARLETRPPARPSTPKVIHSRAQLNLTASVRKPTG